MTAALILGRVAHDARGVINGSGQVGPDCPHGLAAHVSSLRAYDLTNNFTKQVRGHVMTGGIDIMQPLPVLYAVCQ